MTRMTRKPHDAIFKAAFEHPEHAAAFLRGVLPAALVQAIARTPRASPRVSSAPCASCSR